MLTVLLTSPRVAPGLLTWQAWSVLRAAQRVLAESAGHPQLAALASAGVPAEIIDAPPGGEPLAARLSAAAGGADGDRPVVWLAPPGENADPEVLGALSVPFRQLRGSHDLPGAHLLDVVGVMDTLRTSCPWDRQQTHSSLTPYLLEEAYEAVETVESGDLTALREELGDVLLQVAFHARIAAERPPGDGGYTIDDVADTLVAKLVRRHPHVFADVLASSPEAVARNWDEIKKAERAQRARESASASAPSVLDGVAFGQPALSLATQLQRRAERAGLTVPADSTGPAESTGTADRTSPREGGGELGDELMGVVARARAAGLDPELELRTAARRFADRVRAWERSQAT